MDTNCEFEQVYEFINRVCDCKSIKKIDSSIIDFTPVINGKEVDLKELNVYEVDMYVDGDMLSDEMNYMSFSAIAYVFMYNKRVYYIDCKHVQCDKHEFVNTHIRFRPVLSTAFDVHLLKRYINNMYKYGYGHEEDKTSMYTTFSRDITKYTTDYHAYTHCFNRRGWRFFKQPVDENEACCYVDYRYEGDCNCDRCK